MTDEKAIQLNAQLLDPRNVHIGQKLCEKVMKTVTAEHPFAALIALCMALPLTADACKLPRGVVDTFELLKSFQHGLREHGNDMGVKLIIPQ